MDVMAAMVVVEAGQTRFCEACDWDAGAGEFIRSGREMPRTLPGPNDCRPVRAKTGGKLRIERRKIISPQAAPGFADAATGRFAKTLSDTGCMFFGRVSAAGESSWACCGRPPCSINQRASMAAEFSSIQRSR